MTGAEYANLVATYVSRRFAPRGLQVYREVRVGKTIIGKNRCIDIFCVSGDGREAFAIECKFQDSQGTVDEKIPYALDDLQALPMAGCVAYAGRGFSVVSGDIRNLAREASESADRVKETVRSISDQITFVRRDLEQIVTSAEAEVEKNQSVFAALDAIERDVAALGAGSAVILQGADAIMIAVGQAAAGARQIASAAEEASAASKQAAQASSEQARGAEDLAAAIEEIASLAEELKSANG